MDSGVRVLGLWIMLRASEDFGMCFLVYLCLVRCAGIFFLGIRRVNRMDLENLGVLTFGGFRGSRVLREDRWE